MGGRGEGGKSPFPPLPQGEGGRACAERKGLPEAWGAFWGAPQERCQASFWKRLGLCVSTPHPFKQARAPHRRRSAEADLPPKRATGRVLRAPQEAEARAARETSADRPRRGPPARRLCTTRPRGRHAQPGGLGPQLATACAHGTRGGNARARGRCVCRAPWRSEAGRNPPAYLRRARRPGSRALSAVGLSLRKSSWLPLKPHYLRRGREGASARASPPATNPEPPRGHSLLPLPPSSRGHSAGEPLLRPLLALPGTSGEGAGRLAEKRFPKGPRCAGSLCLKGK